MLHPWNEGSLYMVIIPYFLEVIYFTQPNVRNIILKQYLPFDYVLKTLLQTSDRLLLY